ncbi:MAG: hypothetical protein MI740_05720 [Halanaerobiales bacterium]|nr:hypothetical protein [Halanaerobiales bacterium]
MMYTTVTTNLKEGETLSINQNTLKAIVREINENGILLLNSTPEMPNITDLGGDWNLVMLLIEKREIFVSKLYKGKTTYLSREMYYMLKDKIRNTDLNEEEGRVFNFIESNDNVDTKVLKLFLGYNSKHINKILLSLQKKLMITVLRRGETLNKNWSTYYWGTYKQWENTDSNCIRPVFNCDLVLSKLRNIMKDKDIEKIFHIS